MFFFLKQGLAILKHFWNFFRVPVTVSSYFKSCSKRLCEGIGPNLRKDDCYEITLAIFHELLIHAAFGQRKSEKSVNHYILLGMIKKMFSCCWKV